MGARIDTRNLQIHEKKPLQTETRKRLQGMYPGALALVNTFKPSQLHAHDNGRASRRSPSSEPTNTFPDLLPLRASSSSPRLFRHKVHCAVVAIARKPSGERLDDTEQGNMSRSVAIGIRSKPSVDLMSLLQKCSRSHTNARRPHHKARPASQIQVWLMSLSRISHNSYVGKALAKRSGQEKRELVEFLSCMRASRCTPTNLARRNVWLDNELRASGVHSIRSLTTTK